VSCIRALPLIEVFNSGRNGHVWLRVLKYTGDHCDFEELLLSEGKPRLSGLQVGGHRGVAAAEVR